MSKNILDEIVENKKKELLSFRTNPSTDGEVRNLVKRKNADAGFPCPKMLPANICEVVAGCRRVANARNDIFIQKLTATKQGGIALIAEIKLKSPSSGVLASKEILIKRAIEYEKAGADCISVITDYKYFGGDTEFIKKIKSRVSLPILQKDFVIDQTQIYEAKIIGSDAILLIAKIVDEEKLKEFVDLAKKIGVEPVVEVYDEQDLEKALKTKVKIIGVNARNLNDFKVDVKGACKLLAKIPYDKIKIGFSGVKSCQDVEEYKKAGAKAVLVGTALMKAKNVKSFINELKTVKCHLEQ